MIKAFAAAVALSLASAASAVSTSTLYTGDFSLMGFAANNTVLATGTPMSVSFPTSGSAVTIFKPATDEAESGATFIIPNFTAVGDFRADLSVNVSGTRNFTSVPTIFGGYAVNFNAAAGVNDSSQISFMKMPGLGSVVGQSFVLDDGTPTTPSSQNLGSRSNIVVRVERVGQTVTQLLSTDGQTFSEMAHVSGAGFTGAGKFSFSLNAAQPNEDGASVTFKSFTVSAIQAPVPEPGEWAMMAGGLAIVGGLARRRAKKA